MRPCLARRGLLIHGLRNARVTATGQHFEVHRHSPRLPPTFRSLRGDSGCPADRIVGPRVQVVKDRKTGGRVCTGFVRDDGAEIGGTRPPRVQIRGLLASIFAAAILAGCGSAATTTTSATTTSTTSHAAKVKVDAKKHAAVEKLLKGGPTRAQTAAVDRECTVPNHAQIHTWLDAEWGGRSTISVADQIAREIRGHVTSSQRSDLALECIARISQTGS